MNSLRRATVLIALVGLLAAAATLAQPEPPQARANVACDVGSSIAGGVGPVAGAIGLGNPASGVCDAVTSKVAGAVTKPITDAVKGLGNSVFEQVTTWTAEGATWLIGRVVAGIEKTTTPDLTSKGFLSQYAKMAQIAALLGAAMLLFAILEAVAQNSWQVLGKAVFVNVPIAFIGTSVAFTVVQMLLLTTDQMSHAVSVATHHHSEQFFKSAVTALSESNTIKGGLAATGPAGATAPLFVTFLAAIIGAFAAFCVWMEMLMRDAAVYVVALFMPLSLATFVSPRWSGILRRTCELLVVVIGSKFVIVSIIALAAALVSEEGAPVEHLLAAAALLLLSCFAPFVLMRMVLSTEGAMSAAYGRRSASGGAHSAMQLTSEAVMVRNMARSNRGNAEPPEVWSIKSGGNGGSGGGGVAGGGAGAPKPGGGGGAAAAGAGGGGSAGAGSVGGAAGGAGAAAAVPGAAIRGVKSASQRLEGTAAAQSSGAGGSGSRSGSSAQGVDSGLPGREDGAGPPDPAASSSAPHPAAERAARPPQDLDVKPPSGSEKT